MERFAIYPVGYARDGSTLLTEPLELSRRFVVRSWLGGVFALLAGPVVPRQDGYPFALPKSARATLAAAAAAAAARSRRGTRSALGRALAVGLVPGRRSAWLSRS